MKRSSAIATALAVMLMFGSVLSVYPISNVVVLMLENRSFDHMLGHLKQSNPQVDGLDGNEWNPLNTSDPQSPRVTVNFNAAWVDPDPGHSYEATTEQCYGEYPPTKIAHTAPMNGFVQNARKEIGNDRDQTVMSCFRNDTAPIISTLAQEFAVFDAWHSSVPGPTEVNRLFVHSATSHGSYTNDIHEMIAGYPQKPIYVSLYENGKSYKIYYQIIPSAIILSQMRTFDQIVHFQPFEQFLKDAEEGTLPNYSFIDPRYYPFQGQPANDQHPSHSVGEGEKLVKEVYEALRASPQWNSTLLIVTYDEHGGFYDHFPPPTGVPNPDGLGTVFDFTRLGVRVPMVMASPWIKKGTVEHDGKGPFPNSAYDHTSIPATLKKIFDLPSFLTKRDAWASTFEHIVNLDAPRTDCPEKLPEVVTPPSYSGFERERQQPVSHLQKSFISMMSALDARSADEIDTGDSLANEAEAGEHVHAMVQNYLQRWF